MPLLNSLPTDPVAKRAAVQSQIRERAVTMANQQLQALARMYNNGINFVWNHNLLSPQEVCDGLGVDAAEVFTVHGELATMITTQAVALGVDPAVLSMQLPKNDFTKNPDGTVTVGTGSYTPPA